MRPSIRYDGNYYTLICPVCESSYLHHDLKSIKSEGEQTGFSDHYITSIEFWCEDCDGNESPASLVFNIEQHEGNTSLKWVVKKKPKA